MRDVIQFTDATFVKVLDAREKFEAIEELASVFKGSPICADTAELIEALAEREHIMSTGIGFSLAIPHVKIPAVKQIAFAIGISKDGLPFDSMDGHPVHLVILVVAGESQHKEYLRLLAQIMAIVKKPEVRDALIAASSAQEVMDILADAKS